MLGENEMTIMDLVIVVSIFGGFGYLIIHRLEQKKPGATKKFMEWLGNKKDEIKNKPEISNERYVFEGDRGMM